MIKNVKEGASNKCLFAEPHPLELKKIAKRAAVAKKAKGFLHQQKCRHACVLSLNPIVEKNSKEGSIN